MRLKKELIILNHKLLGKFISRFSLGDTWDFFLDEYFLSAQKIECKDESKISELLKHNYDEYNYSVDKQEIAKSTIITANLRKKITRIDLDEVNNLILDFENGSELKLLTNSEIVDWQWYINKSGKDPYIDYEIACFHTDEIKINE